MGDIATGIAAPLVARRALRFNAFGITDLLVALTLGGLTGFQLINVGPSAIGELPLALIPTAGVPLFLVLHITAVSALWRARETSPAATAT